MLQTELLELIDRVLDNRYETSTIELKKAKGGAPTNIYDTLSSFSNTHGGIIIFGIDETDGFNVTGVYDVQDLQKKITSQCDQMQPRPSVEFSYCRYEDKDVVACEVSELEPYDKPCYYKGKGMIKGSYKRVGESDIPLTEYEVYSYEAFKRRIEDELRVVERATVDDLDKRGLNIYFDKIDEHKAKLSQFDDEKILKLQGIINEDGRPTICGLMVFGIYPQAFYPQLSITAVLIDGYEYVSSDDTRFIDNKRIEGNIEEMLKESLAFIKRNSKRSTVINNDGKREDTDEYPMKAIREVILNALIHRDYSMYTDTSPVTIKMFKDRIEVENPGEIYGSIDIKDLGNKSANTRNPFIAGALEVLDITENRFSGVPTIYKEMNDAGLSEPLFESSQGTFKVTLYNKEVREKNYDRDLSNTDRMILSFCKEPKTRNEIAALIDIGTISYVTRKFLDPLIAKGLLHMTNPDHPRSKNQKYFSSL